MERKNLLVAVTRALKIARVRESRVALLCDSAWCRKLRLLPPKVLRNKLKYIIGNCTLRTLKAMQDIFRVDREVQSFAKYCIRKRNNVSATDLAGTSNTGNVITEPSEYCDVPVIDFFLYR